MNLGMHVCGKGWGWRYYIAWAWARINTINQLVDQVAFRTLDSIGILSGVKVYAPPQLGQRIDPSKLVNGANTRRSLISPLVYISLSTGRG